MNARHHLVQPPKKKSLEDNVFETRVATMKFTNTGASGRRDGVGGEGFQDEESDVFEHIYERRENSRERKKASDG